MKNQTEPLRKEYWVDCASCGAHQTITNPDVVEEEPLVVFCTDCLVTLLPGFKHDTPLTDKQFEDYCRLVLSYCHMNVIGEG